MTYPAAARSAHLRAQAELVRERDDHAVQARLGMGFDRGAYDTLNWLIAGGAGPLTGEMVGLPIPAALVVRELAAAEAVLSGPPGRCHGYAAGVLNTLMWAEMVTPEPPRPGATVRPDAPSAAT